jgi:transposase InsO family protein
VLPASDPGISRIMGIALRRRQLGCKPVGVGGGFSMRHRRGEMMELTLSAEEIYALTGYRRASNQLRVLREMNIPARRRPDNAVTVMRMHCLHPATLQPQVNKPQLKSHRK